MVEKIYHFFSDYMFCFCMVCVPYILLMWLERGEIMYSTFEKEGNSDNLHTSLFQPLWIMATVL